MRGTFKGMKQLRRTGLSALLAAMTLLNLAACGGGGGSANVRPADPPPAAPPPAPPPPPPVVSAPNPAYGKHLALTNAAFAHTAGFTGQGVRIGVIDSGVNRTHPALSPRVTHNLVYIGAPNNLAVDDVVGHGTGVSQIMAGTPFGAWPGGIAPGAQIISARIISDKPPADDGSGQGNEVDGALGLKPIHQDLINRGARIMNNSWGGLYWTNLNATAPIADEYRPFVVNNDGLVVFATGNSSFANPSDMAALPSKAGPNGSMPAADLERGWLAVAALDTDNPTQLAGYSNACGIAMRYCLVAPGNVVVTGTNDSPTSPTYWNWRGTSLAAPQVSGAAALVWQKFPYFSNDLVRQTLLGTATDLGQPGVDPVFGYGLLNIAWAMRGPSRLDWGDTVVKLDSGTSTWSNPISGTGGLVKQGAGKLILAEPNTYTGRTQVLGGELQVEREITSSVTIGSAGTLSGYARVGAVDNAGMLRVDNVMRVVGDYQQASTGRLGLMLGGWLYVEGTATLDGALHVLGARQGYVASSYTPFLSARRIVGQFNALTSASGVFLDATIHYRHIDQQSDAWLDVRRIDVSAAAQAMGLTAISLSSAERIEGAFDTIDAHEQDRAGGRSMVADGFRDAAGAIQRSPNAAAAERTLSSLSGELHAADIAFAKLAIDGNRHALQSHLGHGRVEAGAWSAQVDAERGLSHFGLQSDGWLIGHDRRVRDNLVMGVAISETDSLVQSELRNDRERNHQVEGQLYAQWKAGPHYLSGRAALGRMERALQRELFLGAESFGVDSDYASHYQSLSVEAGRRVRFGSDGAITPYAGVQAVRMERDGFSEAGAFGFGLASNASQWQETQGLLGLRTEHGWNVAGMRMALQAHAEWQHVLSQTGYDIDARFDGIDAWSPIRGRASGGDAGTVGIGFELHWDSGSALRLSLDARREAGETWQQAMLRWVRPF